ncbi:hypothetical protein B0J17DRAFT_684504, partial [Rhizoctonia solani]
MATFVPRVGHRCLPLRAALPSLVARLFATLPLSLRQSPFFNLQPLWLLDGSSASPLVMQWPTTTPVVVVVWSIEVIECYTRSRVDNLPLLVLTNCLLRYEVSPVLVKTCVLNTGGRYRLSNSNGLGGRVGLGMNAVGVKCSRRLSFGTLFVES